jgi:hypothetical protein
MVAGSGERSSTARATQKPDADFADLDADSIVVVDIEVGAGSGCLAQDEIREIPRDIRV